MVWSVFLTVFFMQELETLKVLLLLRKFSTDEVVGLDK